MLPEATTLPSILKTGTLAGFGGVGAFGLTVTDADGGALAYEANDPSLHNWMGLALALRGVAISDFPLCNKSFNLSYAGHDL